ncbi:MAG: glucose 1-dehydrogenase [Alphaproteobacteria bacterium]|nr:glucose 1-dehydrogenase [Alphaproteobacteria bacterium]
MADRLEGKTAIVTGGASGIGRATCKLFADEGAKIVVADIDMDGAQATVESIGAAACPHALNVTKEEAWEELMASGLGAEKNLDILVNCAGIGRAGSFEELSLEDWNAMVAVNLTGVFLGCKHACKAMRRAGNGGSIVNISSIAGLVGGSDIAGYSATKGGVTMLSKSVALHGARHGIRCNSVHPTYVDSEMLDPIVDAFPDRETMLAGMAQEVPIGRVATPQDIAYTILFLASDESAMVTGSALVADGGQLAGLPSKHSG